MNQWQPIKTAPKDGRLIVSARFEKDSPRWVKEACWVRAQDIAEMNGGEEKDYEPAWASLGDEEDPIYPTHWVPMPDPPAY